MLQFSPKKENTFTPVQDNSESNLKYHLRLLFPLFAEDYLTIWYPRRSEVLNASNSELKDYYG